MHHLDIINEIYFDSSIIKNLINFDSNGYINSLKTNTLSSTDVFILDNIMSKALYVKVHGKLQTFNDFKISKQLIEKIHQLKSNVENKKDLC